MLNDSKDDATIIIQQDGSSHTLEDVIKTVNDCIQKLRKRQRINTFLMENLMQLVNKSKKEEKNILSKMLSGRLLDNEPKINYNGNIKKFVDVLNEYKQSEKNAVAKKTTASSKTCDGSMGIRNGP